jgi:ComF family protein
MTAPANDSILGSVLAHLLPSHCSMCRGALETASQCLCDACVSELPWIDGQCQQCAVPLPTDALCPDCQSKPPCFRRCIAAFTYQTPVDSIVLRLKSDPYTAEIKQLTALLGERIIDSYQQTGTALPQLIIPMPLHWQKMTQRGFNQSHVLSKLLANYFLRQHKIPLSLRSDLCYRASNRQAQHTLNKNQRAKSVKDAFRITAQEASSLKGLSVAVLDDVVTTGSTANAIASTLLNTGVKQVDIWCLARTSWNNSNQ